MRAVLMKMMLGAMVFLVGAGAGAGSAQAQIRPGLYENTITMNIPGAPAPRSNVSTHCVTAEEAKNPADAMARGMQNNQNCRFTKKEFTAGHFVGDMVCTGQQTGNSTAHMDFIFTDNGGQGTMTMVMQIPNMPQPMTMVMNSKSVRKGDCS